MQPVTKKQKIFSARSRMGKKQRPLELVRLIVKQHPKESILVLKHWLKRKNA